MQKFEWRGKKEAKKQLATPLRKKLIQEEDGFGDDMFIEGDNLEAMRLLRPKYEGKIKLVYADPPYNTGTNSLTFKDTAQKGEGRKQIGGSLFCILAF